MFLICESATQQSNGDDWIIDAIFVGYIGAVKIDVVLFQIYAIEVEVEAAGVASDQYGILHPRQRVDAPLDALPVKVFAPEQRSLRQKKQKSICGKAKKSRNLFVEKLKKSSNLFVEISMACHG